MMAIDELRKQLRADLKAACRSHLLALAEADIDDDIPEDGEVNGFINMLVRESRPVASLCCTPLGGPGVMGASRIMGTGDMPPNLDWAEYEGKPMAFLAQFDLAQLPAGIDWPVPKTGWLYLFCAEATITDHSVQRRQDIVVAGRYFGGALQHLQPRLEAPANVARPSCLTSVVPQSVDFKLGLSVPIVEETFCGYAWEEDYPSCNLLLDRDCNGNELEIGSKGLVPLITGHDDRLFGYRHFNPELITDVRMWAAIRGAGFHQVALFPETASASIKTYNDWDIPDASKQEFAAFAKKRAAIKAESAHWDQLLSLGRSCGFDWGTFADGLQVFVDKRKSATGDFSNLQSFNRYLMGYD